MSHLSKFQLLGVDESHLSPVFGHDSVKMHHQIIEPLTVLIEAAAEAGFSLRIASGFRSFDRQRFIWNAKCQGRRPVLDRSGEPLDIANLTVAEKVHAILHWSALPGASRHHWGTDCDIYDAAAVTEDYQLQLHPDEYTGNGPFAPMIEWFQQWIAGSSSPEFYQPYWNNPHSGIAPEPWHISYRPLAAQCEEQLSPELLRECLLGVENSELEEKQYLLKELDTIYHQYIELV